MIDAGGEWDPEFKHAPFDLLRCEVMLTNRSRQFAGRPIPSPRHDLVSVLGASQLSVPAFEEHELLQRVSSTFENCFG